MHATCRKSGHAAARCNMPKVLIAESQGRRPNTAKKNPDLCVRILFGIFSVGWSTLRFGLSTLQVGDQRGTRRRRLGCLLDANC